MFGNLKFYSEYSLEYGSFKIIDFFKLCKKKKYDFACLTDVFNLSGSLEFIELAKKNKIKPIIGCEVFIENKISSIIFSGKVTLIAKNELGFKKICKIISYKKRKIKFHDIIDNNLIILSGGYNGLYTNILKNRNSINIITKIIKKNLNNNFYIEIQRFNKNSYRESLKLIKISRKFNIPLVATHPIRFLKKSDFKLFKYKYCIIKKEYLVKKKLKIYKNNYFLSKKKFINKFNDILSSIKNSENIANQCFFEFDKKRKRLFINDKKNFSKYVLSEFKKKKFTNSIYKKRIYYEIKIIKKMGFIEYFLIVSDFIKWAKKKDIQIGPGRGSSASSLVSFVLGITSVDPLKYNLFFERFLNKKKNSLPDFDIDVCKKNRYKLIDYIKKKYGNKKVFNIVTFGKFSFKNSIKDSGRILGYNFSYLNKISNSIYFEKKYNNLSDIINKNLFLKKYYIKDKKFKKILKISLKLDGFIRNIGVHAGGIIITNKIFYNFFPIYYLKKEKKFICQFNKNNIENLGFIKFDILGLNTLTILKDMTKRININFTYETLDLKNKITFDLIKKGNTTGVFQLENYNLKKYLRIIKPYDFKEIVNIISLYRPGPICMINEYCENKISFNFNKKTKEILKSTRGFLIFQEQLLELMTKNFGLNLNEADIFRTYLSKNNKKKIKIIKKRILNIKNKRKIKKLILIFNYLKKFSGYSFNKAHAVSYSFLTYSMAWFKAHYKSVFYLSNFNFCYNNRKKLKKLYSDSIINKIFFKNPDINISDKYFIFFENYIISGLLFIKGIGKKAINSITSVRSKKKFISFMDFYFRVDKSIVNKRIIKNLIISGCFDSICKNRSKLLFELEFFNKNNFYYSNIFNNQLTVVKKKIKYKLNNINVYKNEKLLLGYFFSNIFKKYNKKILILRKNLNKQIKSFYGMYFKKQKINNFYIIKLENEFSKKRYFFAKSKKITKVRDYDIIILFYDYKIIKKKFKCHIKKIIKLNE
ncbi:DNA polymerase III subunit alpha [Candidatus Vidania fulgoroideorum]